MLNFLPRDDKYFERFTELAVRIHEAAQILDRFFKGEASVGTVADQIKRLEHECDEISHEILRGIDRTFITPIDREDIHQLAVRLDDVIDLIDGTVRRVVALPDRQADAPLDVALADRRVDHGRARRGRLPPAPAEGRHGPLPSRSSSSRTKATSCTTRRSRPSSADNLPAIEVIKWKDVYDNMERCIDSCVVVAHVLESVVLKHS